MYLPGRRKPMRPVVNAGHREQSSDKQVSTERTPKLGAQ